MTDPPRLFDIAADPFARRLLGSAQADGGSAAVRARCVAIASATTVVASKSIASAATAASATVGAGVAFKAVAVGLVLGLSVQGVTALHGRSDRVASPASNSRLQSTPEPKPSASAAVQWKEPSEAATPAEIPAVAPSPSAPLQSRAQLQIPSPRSSQRLVAPVPSSWDYPATPVVEPVLPRPDDSLDREVRLIDDARRSSMAGDNERALLLLDRHRQQFASGALGPEALVIRVRVLTALGRHSEAAALAKPVITANADSAIAKRLSSALGNSARSTQAK